MRSLNLLRKLDPRRPYIPRFFARASVSEYRNANESGGGSLKCGVELRLAGRSSDRWSRLRRVLAPKFPAERDRASDPITDGA